MTPAPGTRSTQHTCPDANLLRGYASGQLPADLTNQLVLHVVRCARCTALLLALPDTTGSVIQSLHLGLPAGPSDLARTPVKTAAHLATTPPHGGLAPDVRGQRLGRYAIRRRLGHGGFGIIYLAYDTELSREVAIKVPHADRLAEPAQLALYHAEAQLHASLDHAHIVPIHDVGRTAEVPFYLVSKYIDGENLAERLARQPPTPRETAALLLPLAEALQYMHGRGLVHRDIKPNNVLLDGDGKPYLTDFGLARRLADEGGALNFVGTPAYMSPEQARGEGDRADGRCDIYSLGVVLYEMLTGRRPFLGDRSALREQILYQEPTAVRVVCPQVPAELEAICRKAMAKDIEARYRTAGAMAADLRRFLAAKAPRRAVAVALAVAAALLLLAAAWALGRRNGSASNPPLAGPPGASDPVRVVVPTEPAGASVTFIPLDGETGLPRPEGRTAGTAGAAVSLLPGRYLVVAVLNGADAGRFHEVYRTVPGPRAGLAEVGRHNGWKRQGDTVHLPIIRVPPATVTRDMCLFPASAAFRAGDDQLPLNPPRRHRVPAFYLDTTEVTRAAYRRQLDGNQFQPRPGDPSEVHPVVDLMWDQVVAYAEGVGKRLPDEIEYEYAATACGASRFPWGDDEKARGGDWAFGPVRSPSYDALTLPGQPTVYGLYSNVAEWTGSWADPSLIRVNPPIRLRVVRGGPPSVVEGNPRLSGTALGPRERFALEGAQHRRGLGFRCARSAMPRLLPEHFAPTAPP